MPSDRQDRPSVPDISPDHLKFDWTSFFVLALNRTGAFIECPPIHTPDTCTFLIFSRHIEWVVVLCNPESRLENKSKDNKYNRDME